MLAIVVTGGCSKIGGHNSPSQVAARVNSDEITVHQINYVLAREPGVTPENSDRAKRGILSRLIDQELAKQQAIDAKLDRTPDVLQALEFARTEILARAYLARLVASQPKPTPEEIKQYYAEHPELFARRHLYLIEEIALSPKADVAGALRDEVAVAKSMAQIAVWLKSRGVTFAESRGARAAEQISLEMLPALQSMKDGEIRVLPAHGGGLRVVHIIGSKLSPIDEPTAEPRIRLFLSNRRASEAIAKEMRRLKERASIEYIGEFARESGATENDAELKAGEGQSEKPDGPRTPAGLEPAAKDVERGVRGLFNK